MDGSVLQRGPAFLPNRAARGGVRNHSHIKHGGYFVDVNYPQDEPNPHNRSSIQPQTFPMRSNTNFLDQNKQYDELHRFDPLLE